MTVEASVVALVAIHLFPPLATGISAVTSQSSAKKTKTKIQNYEHVLKNISRLTARSQILLLIKMHALLRTETLPNVSGAAVRG